VVLRRWSGLDFELREHDQPWTSIRLAGAGDGRAITIPDRFLATPDADWLTERSLPRPPFDAARPSGVPVLFPPAEGSTGTPPADEGMTLDVDVFGTAFFFLTRYEEVVRRARDRHGRFPASASVARAAGWLDRPIVDESVALLWAGMDRLWPRLERRQPEFRLWLTHDVDEPWSAYRRPPSRVVRSLAADLTRRRDPWLAGRRLRAIVDARRGRVDRDPFHRFDAFMDASERHGLRNTFFIQAGGRPDDVDFRYHADDPAMLALLRRIHERGHEIGLHGSYVSHGSVERLAAERAALTKACTQAGSGEVDIRSVRQHFLRFEAPQTWRDQAAAGLAEDSSLGFADDIGFRAGTSRAFPAFDLRERRTLDLLERPLVAMDTTLVEYLGLELDEAARRVRSVVERCRAHGGEAVVLYHNNTLPGAAFERHYRELVDALVG
jgi:hypothetical protein